jgi:hypothetical protein
VTRMASTRLRNVSYQPSESLTLQGPGIGLRH